MSVKIFKNKHRSESENIKPYTPEYKSRGMVFDALKSAIVDIDDKPIPFVGSNQVKKNTIRQEYGNISSKPLGKGRDVVPNIGNDMEHAWSGVDGVIVDDLDIDPNQPMIDNNDFVDIENNKMDAKLITKIEEDGDQESLHSMINNLSDEECLLILDGQAICSGPIKDIQEEVKGLVYGDHDLCTNGPFTVDRILVAKKMPIKIGVFIE